MASRLYLLLLLCMVPALVSAIRPGIKPLVVRGRVYCDPCRAGFETSATTYIPGASIRLECKDRNTLKLHYINEKSVTDSSGTYTIFVHEDHKDDICDVTLISSSQIGCQIPSPGRDKARVILTRYNGIATDNRFANSMGFMKDKAESGCSKTLSQYQEVDG